MSASCALLPTRTPEEVADFRGTTLDAETLEQANNIVEQVRKNGDSAVRFFAQHFADLDADSDSLFISRAEMQNEWEHLDANDKGVLERTHQRIATFAEAQLSSLRELNINSATGRAGHRLAPLSHAGCYAPGGRYPLPSSVLMTVTPARIAGVRDVTVASPKPTRATLAAAYIAGADRVLRVGGAQAIAALAFGLSDLARCDIIVGPGNRWVTAAKKLVSGYVAIDMLAGPSELLIIADRSARPEIIAADLLAQAEHDPDAVPMLIALDEALCEPVQAELHRQMESLPTRAVAARALSNGFLTCITSVEKACALANTLAPEHLEILVNNASDIAPRLKHFGALFCGEFSAEVLGDYGAGPNHVLPTAGAARYTAGLSVFQFLRTPTWLELQPSANYDLLVADAIALARMEGLEAHARAAELRSINKN